VEHSIAHRETIEDVHLVNHIIVAHREELSDGLDWRIHGEEWIGGSTDGETHHAPKRTDTHRHAQGRHQSEGKDTEALTGQYAQNAQQYDGRCTSRMREFQYIIDVELEEQEDAQEDERLRAIFTTGAVVALIE
jgi:hypothetical protein